jgi:hypothetical protein
MRVGSPAVKVAHHSDPLSIRRPYRKVSARTPRPGGIRARACDLDRVRTELFIRAEMRAFTEEIDVLFRKHGVGRSKPHACWQVRVSG